MEQSTATGELRRRFEMRQARVAIIGLGYVGLPLACAAAAGGFKVIGLDIDPAKPDAINAGHSYFDHIPAATVAEQVRAGRLTATTDFAALSAADAVIICVPTPLTRQRDPDLSFVVRTAETIAKHLRPAQLVVLESTTWPGTTVEVVRPILESSRRKSGSDFYLAYSPEREDPGNAEYGTARIPKVVGGDGADALALAVALYSGIVAEVVPVSSTQTAEAVKLTENIFRAVNIALVNELKVVFDAMGIDVWEVIEAAKTKPFGFMPFYPGPGLGGHCIPIDPFYLTWKAREFELPTRFVELAGEINTAMPRYVVHKLGEALDRRSGRGLNGARVLLVGLAYKKNVSDIRESPALRLMEILEERGAAVDFHDPLVATVPATREHANLTGRKSVARDAIAAARYDAILIVTDHDDVDYAGLLGASEVVVDTRDVFARLGIVSDKVTKA